MLGVVSGLGSATPTVSTVVEWRRMGKTLLVFLTPIERFVFYEFRKEI